MSSYYVASNAGDERDGVYLVDSGATTAHRVASCPRVSSLGWHPNLRLLYALGHAEHDELHAWRCHADGQLEPLNVEPLAGEVSCALTVQSGAVFVAHYQSGQVSRVALDDDGMPGAQTVVRLVGSGPDPRRQATAHPHHVRVLGSGRLLVTDLGADRGWLLENRTLAVVSSIRLPAGSGPRHAVELPDGRLAFSGELDQTLIIAAADGRNVTAYPSTDRVATERNYPSDIAWQPSEAGGGVVIVANRGADSLTTYRMDADGFTRVAEVDAAGEWPLNLELAGSELAVANRDGDRVSFFDVSPSDATPICRSFVPVPHPAWVVPARHPNQNDEGDSA